MFLAKNRTATFMPDFAHCCNGVAMNFTARWNSASVVLFERANR
ncbi:unnamed protein product [Haemonchus placei]|uniref:Uncharacterized protein n=1 Tax=Haemonchus placei TaxID=6290 RepID=A0A3P7SYK5_HAEPC|nr:unnamed protein product [Haemonchus placei]